MPFPQFYSLVFLLLMSTIIIIMRKSGEKALFFYRRDDKRCNLFSGRWVFDDVDYPLYKEEECSFLEYDFTCKKNGRKNFKYQNWRWQPHDCPLPRFNGKRLMEKLRGKKLVFVGDSMNKNQWKSLLCMIEPHLIPSSNKTTILEGNLKFFHSHEYDATIGFYWAPMLIESNCDNIELHRFSPKKWGEIDGPDTIYQPIDDKARRFEMALNSWSDWLEIHINRTKTKLFFMSFSPYREWKGNNKTAWGTDFFCYGRVEPIFDEGYWPSAVHHDMVQVVEAAIEKLAMRGVKVEYLNITRLSSFREDAHLSTDRVIWHELLKNYDKKPLKYSDCLHWCLPGVPDVWNEILYDYIMRL